MTDYEFKDYRDYKNKYSDLVELEREEEMERHEKEIRNMHPKERESKGRALLNMKGKDEGKGLGGKYLIKFVRGERLPDTEISVGDLVMVSKNEPLNSDNPTGTVIERTNYSITVAFNQKPFGFVYGKNLRIDLYVNDITFQRMLDALKNLENVKEDKKHLKNIILGKETPRFTKKEDIEIKNSELNHSQKKAVERSLEADDIFLIHGPPGTGKTTTLIEVIEQHIEEGKKVLATADSNVAVDNIVDFLAERNRKPVRVGHPARVTETLREHTLDYLVEEKDKYRKSQNLRDKADKLDDEQDNYTYPSGRWRRGLSDEAIKSLAKKGKGSRGIPPKKIKSMSKWLDLQEQINDLIQESKELENQAIDELIENADVVCTTNSTAGSELMENRNFDVVVIDEATQATEPSCLIPITHANKVVMAGDHKQLPPTILNQEAKQKGLEQTLFERMIHINESEIKEMLNKQYRMNNKIMNFSSQKFYNNNLEASEQVSNHKLDIEKRRSKEKVEEIIDPENIITYVDTQGKYPERTREGSTSKENPKEAELVKEIVEKLLNRGIDPMSIGVISPYDDQIDLLNKKMNMEELEVKTVDGFQGREKEIIILSLVRSNKKGEIGFLEDLRRLNVSITRAKKKLILIGDSRTLNKHETYAELINYIENEGNLIKV